MKTFYTHLTLRISPCATASITLNIQVEKSWFEGGTFGLEIEYIFYACQKRNHVHRLFEGFKITLRVLKEVVVFMYR